MARSLSLRERGALDLLLSVDFSGVSELRAQAQTVTADRAGIVVDLIADQTLPAANTSSRNPVEGVCCTDR